MPAPKLLLTAATYHDSTGNMSTNLTTWQEPFDYVILMNHDVFGPATSPFLNDVAGKTPHVAGPSAPLANACRSRSDVSWSRDLLFHIYV